MSLNESLLNVATRMQEAAKAVGDATGCTVLAVSHFMPASNRVIVDMFCSCPDVLALLNERFCAAASRMALPAFHMTTRQYEGRLVLIFDLRKEATMRASDIAERVGMFLWLVVGAACGLVQCLLLVRCLAMMATGGATTEALP